MPPDLLLIFCLGLLAGYSAHSSAGGGGIKDMLAAKEKPSNLMAEQEAL